jgi:DNA polymerase III epsilon subunit-like protein
MLKLLWKRFFPPALDHPIVILDLETTGVGIKNNNIIEIALIAVDKHLAVKDYLVIPVKLNGRAHWNKEAEAVHGISEDSARKQGVILSEALDMIDEFMAKHYVKRAIPCGFNVHFDMKLLEVAYEKKERKHPFNHTIHCLNTLGRNFFNTSSSRHLVPLLGIEVDENKKHRALYDCRLALETLLKMEKYK